MLGTLSAATLISVHGLLDRIKKDAFRRKLRLREFFTDFDPLRSGKVSEAKFRTALDSSGLSLSDPELKSLTDHFVDPSDRTRVRYEDLLNQIEVIFTTSGMETDPRSSVEDFTPHLTRAYPTLHPFERDELEGLLKRLAHFVKTRQVDIRPVFDDYYKNVNSPILVDQVTRVQFRNGLSILGLAVSQEETELLCKAFAGAADGYVDYISFCCAIDPALKTFSAREPRSYIEKPLKSGFRYPIYHADGAPDQPGRPPVSFNQPKLPVQYPARPEVEAILERLREKASQHRLRVYDFFIEFDKHADGTVTQPQFVKRLNVAYDKMGLGLSEAEVELLCSHYAKQMRHGAVHVQWRKFVADIEKAFTTTGMEKNPLATVETTSKNQEPITLAPAKEAAVQKILADLRQRVNVRRVLVKPLFADYGEWSHSIKISDHITRQNMLQSLTRFGINLSADEAQLLYERYDTLGLGTVNYVAFVRDIDQYESFSGRVSSRHVFPQDPDYGMKPTMNSGFWKSKVAPGPVVNVQPGRAPTTNDQPSAVPAAPFAPPLHALLEKLQRTAVQHRLRVEECFKDFDRHRDGTITVPQFQQSVALTWGRALPLSQKEVELLVAEYSVPKSGVAHVAWKRFVRDVDAIFVRPQLEKDPFAAAPPLIASLPRPKGALSAGEHLEIADILKRMRTQCTNRRVLAKPFFTDAEYNRRSMRVVDHITKSQFAQCLSRLSLEASNEEIDLLCRKFNDRGDGFVNYVDFCVAIDPEEQGSDREALERPEVPLFKANGNFKAPKTGVVQPGRAPLVANVPGLLPKRADASGLPELMRRLQEKAIQFKIPVHDYFVDYDKHGTGAISRPQFRRGLNAAFGVSYIQEAATEAELNFLEDVYAREVLDGELFFSWKDFVKDINDAQITPNLEYQPLTTPEPLVPSLGHTLPKLSDAEEAKVAQLLAKMKERFRIRCVYVKAPFHDFALSNNSPVMIDHVTRQQFVQGLARLGIEPAADETELLFKKYDDKGDSSVNYVAFATDVDPTETFSTRERLPSFKATRDAAASRMNVLSDGSEVKQMTTFYGGFRKPKVHEELLRSM